MKGNNSVWNTHYLKYLLCRWNTSKLCKNFNLFLNLCKDQSFKTFSMKDKGQYDLQKTNKSFIEKNHSLLVNSLQ